MLALSFGGFRLRLAGSIALGLKRGRKDITVAEPVAECAHLQEAESQPEGGPKQDLPPPPKEMPPPQNEWLEKTEDI